VRRDPKMVETRRLKSASSSTTSTAGSRRRPATSGSRGTRPQTLCLRADRLARGTGRVDRREVPRLVRLRRRPSKRVHEGSISRQHRPVLVHRARSDRRSGLTTRGCTGPGRFPKADRRGYPPDTRVPARDRAPAAVRGRADLTPTSVAGR
jgi:hypothetical protein